MRVVYKISNSCFITYWLCHSNNFSNYLKLTLLFLILLFLLHCSTITINYINSGINSFQINFIFSVVLSSVFHYFPPYIMIVLLKIAFCINDPVFSWVDFVLYFSKSIFKCLAANY